jgi:hypothetical protein
MARINTSKLIVQATDIADRANFVRKDPAVVKAWNQAGSDVHQALRSTTVAVLETRSAWGRAGDRRLRAARAV